MKIKKLHEKVYNTRLILIYDCRAREAQEYLEKIGVKVDLVKCSGQCGTYTHITGDYAQSRYYIYVCKNQESIYTLLHELSHLVFMTLSDCGIEINQETDEIYAYYFEWWCKKVFPLFGVTTDFHLQSQEHERANTGEKNP